MTVPHRIVCHIKMAISDRTKPDMGWRRAPLANAYAALRQGTEALLEGPAGSRTGSGAPVVVSFMVLCVLCVVAIVASKSHKLQGLQLVSVGRERAAGAVGSSIPAVAARQQRETRLDLQPRRMLGSAGAVLNKGRCQGACHRPDFFVLCIQCVD